MLRLLLLPEAALGQAARPGCSRPMTNHNDNNDTNNDELMIVITIVLLLIIISGERKRGMTKGGIKTKKTRTYKIDWSFKVV